MSDVANNRVIIMRWVKGRYLVLYTYLVDDIEVPSMILKNSKASNSYLKDRGCRLEGVNRRFKIITV